MTLPAILHSLKPRPRDKMRLNATQCWRRGDHHHHHELTAVGLLDTIPINPHNCGRRSRAPPLSISAVHTAGAQRPPRVVMGESPSSLSPGQLDSPALTAAAWNVYTVRHSLHSPPCLPGPATRTHHHQGQLDALLAHTPDTIHCTTSHHSRLVSFHFCVCYLRLEATHTNSSRGGTLPRPPLTPPAARRTQMGSGGESEREPRQRWPRIPRVAKTCNSIHL